MNAIKAKYTYMMKKISFDLDLFNNQNSIMHLYVHFDMMKSRRMQLLNSYDRKNIASFVKFSNLDLMHMTS